VFYCSESFKKNVKTSTYLTIFSHYEAENKAARAATTTTKTTKFMIRILPAGPQPQKISEDISDRMPERIAENI
jgi:hypothetical protein